MKLYEYVLKLRDQASPALKTLKAAAGEAGGEAVRTMKKVAGLDNSVKSLDSSLGFVKRSLASAFIGFSLLGLGQQVLMLGANAEQTKIAYDTMLGSVEKSKQLRGELQKFADITPFNTSDSFAAGQSLLAFGVASKDLIPVLGRLGDISGGNAQKFQSMVDNYGKAVSAQRANTMDLNQFAIAGVPIWSELSKIIGKQGTDLRKYVEENGVSLPQLNQAFVNLTSSGGMFFGMMEKQSKSTLGLWSTFVSKLENAAVQLFEDFSPLIKSVLVLGTGLLGVLSYLSPLIKLAAYGAVVWGAYNLGLVFNIGLQKLQVAWATIQFYWHLRSVLGITLLKNIQLAWNAAMLANPIGLIIVGLVALAGVILYAWNHFEGFRGAVVGIWESMKQLGENIINIFMPVITNLMKAFEALKNGDWSTAATFGVKAMAEIAMMPTKLVGAAFTGELTKGVADAFRKGDAAGRKMGPIASLPGMDALLQSTNPSENTDTKPTGMGDVTGGGSKPLTVNISFRNFIEDLKIESASTAEAFDQTERRLQDMFGRLIDGAVSSTGR